MSRSVGVKKHPGLTRTTRAMTIANAAAAIIAIWFIYFPTPYYPLLASCFLLPLFAIGLNAWAGGASARLEPRWKKYQRSFVSLMTFLALALFYRAGVDLNLSQWLAQVVWILLAAACVCAIAYRLDTSVLKSRRQALPLLLFALVASYGIVGFCDTLLDPFTPRTLVATVSKMKVHVSGCCGKGSSIWYKVSVVPSPPGWGWIDVRPDVYYDLRVGEPACVRQGSGLLGIGWLEVKRCHSA